MCMNTALLEETGDVKHAQLASFQQREINGTVNLTGSHAMQKNTKQAPGQAHQTLPVINALCVNLDRELPK